MSYRLFVSGCESLIYLICYSYCKRTLYCLTVYFWRKYLKYRISTRPVVWDCEFDLFNLDYRVKHTLCCLNVYFCCEQNTCKYRLFTWPVVSGCESVIYLICYSYCKRTLYCLTVYFWRKYLKKECLPDQLSEIVELNTLFVVEMFTFVVNKILQVQDKPLAVCWCAINIEGYVQVPICSTHFNWLVKTAQKNPNSIATFFFTVTQIVTFPGN